MDQIVYVCGCIIKKHDGTGTNCKVWDFHVAGNCGDCKQPVRAVNITALEAENAALREFASSVETLVRELDDSPKSLMNNLRRMIKLNNLRRKINGGDGKE